MPFCSCECGLSRLQRLTQLPEFEQVFLMKLENQPKVLPKQQSKFCGW
jgi:hypothetical protein